MIGRSWLRPTALLVAAYVALLGAATFWLAPVWHEWDWSVFQYLSNLHAPAFATSVAVVDLADYDERAPSRDRQTIAKFIDGLRAHRQHPKAVMLDLYFESICASGDPATCRPDAATAALTKSLDAAAAADPRIPVYATENPIGTQGAGQIDAAFLHLLDRDNVYDHLSAGHTILQLAASDGVFYQRCYRIPQTDNRGNVVGTQDLWALAYRGVMDAAGDRLPACEGSQAEQTMEAVRLGPQPDFAQSVRRVTLGQPFPAGVDFTDKYVIVATLEKDLGPLHKGAAPRSNPELLAWALSDLLEHKNSEGGYFLPLPANEMLAALVAVFAAFTLVAFIAVFQGLRRLQLRAVRPYLPWIAAAAATAFALAAFGALEAWMLFAKQIQPQVSLVALSVCFAGGLCGERGREILLEQSRSIDVAPEESNDYDVFVSYAHEEFSWVYENVFVPLKDARTAGGRKLEIFFDTSSIRVGSGWQDKISLAIDGSRFIVPVYSETYFKRPYCRFEIKRAHRKWIMADESARCVLPVMRGKPVILATVDDIQAVSIDERPGLVAEIIAVILAGVEPPPAAATPVPKAGMT
jgi:TIR domain/CHASE2 domain